MERIGSFSIPVRQGRRPGFPASAPDTLENGHRGPGCSVETIQRTALSLGYKNYLYPGAGLKGAGWQNTLSAGRAQDAPGPE